MRRAAGMLLAVAVLCGCGTAPDGGATSDRGGRATAPRIDTEQFRRYEADVKRNYRTGNYTAALASAKAALEMAPDVAQTWVWVSSLYSAMGQEKQGTQYFDALVARYPDRAEPSFYRGRHQWRSSDVEAALASFQAAARLDPHDAEAAYWQGVVHESLDDLEAARDAYREAYRLDPGSDKKATMLVEVQRRLGQYDDAAQVTDVALTRFPDSADLHYARGQLRLRAMDYAEAEASLRRAIELDPSHREAHETLATVLLRTDRAGEARREQAVASRLMDYEAGKRNMEPHLASSRDPAVPMLLAELELTERHYDDAIRWFSRAIALGGASARPVVGRAEALYSSGDVEGGDADLARLGDLSHPRIELARAARAVATGDADAARTYLATAVRGTLDEREFLRRAADLYDRIGDGARADALLQRAAEAPRTSSGPEDE